RSLLPKISRRSSGSNYPISPRPNTTTRLMPPRAPSNSRSTPMETIHPRPSPFHRENSACHFNNAQCFADENQLQLHLYFPTDRYYDVAFNNVNLLLIVARLDLLQNLRQLLP